MPELNNFDIAGAVRQGMAFGTQQRQLREAEERQRNIADTAELAYHADPGRREELVGHAVGIDPQAGFAMGQQLGSAEDRRNRTLVNMAKMLTSAPEQARPGLYQQMVPTLARFGMSQLPDAYTPETAGVIDQTAQALVQSYAGGSAGGTVHAQRVGADGFIYNIMRDGTVVNTGVEADRQTWFRDHPGMAPELVSEGGRVTPIGQAQAPSGPPGGAGAPIPQGAAPQFVEDNVALANQMIAAGIPESQVDAFLQSRMNPVPGGAPAPAQAQQAIGPPLDYQRGGLAQARPSEAQTAGEVEAARQAQELRFAPQRQAIETQGAIERARGTELAKSESQQAAKQVERQLQGSDVLGLLDAAEVLVPASTGSGVGAMADAAASFFGVTLDGASAIQSLKALSGQLVSKMPRMEGPQSDKDVQMYKDMAGDLANASIPREQRLAALAIIRALHRKYTGPEQQGYVDVPTQATGETTADDPLGIL